MPGLAGALFERCFDLGQRDAARFQHHQQMIEKIRGFRDQACLVFLHGRQPGFDRFLAQFLGAMGDAFVEQRARIGVRRARLGALVRSVFPDRPG